MSSSLFSFSPLILNPLYITARFCFPFSAQTQFLNIFNPFQAPFPCFIERMPYSFHFPLSLGFNCHPFFAFEVSATLRSFFIKAGVCVGLSERGCWRECDKSACACPWICVRKHSNYFWPRLKYRRTVSLWHPRENDTNFPIIFILHQRGIKKGAGVPFHRNFCPSVYWLSPSINVIGVSKILKIINRWNYIIS